MSRESKLMTANQNSVQQTISHYEAFGWELLSINGTQITMSRETQHPSYAELVKLQAAYEECVAEYKSLRAPVAPVAPPPINPGTCVFSFICLVIPCVIYVTYKILQKKKYQEAYSLYMLECDAFEQKKKALKDKMEDIVLQGRTAFFAKHN